MDNNLNNNSGNNGNNDRNNNNNPKRQNVFLLLIAALITMLCMTYFMRTMTQSDSQEITYNEFIEMLEDGKVSKIVIESDRIAITPAEQKSDTENTTVTGVTGTYSSSSRITYYTGIAESYETLTQRVLEYNSKLEDGQAEISVSSEIPDNSGVIMSLILYYVLPIALIWVLLSFLSRRISKNMGPLGMSRSNAKVYVQKETGVTFKDVAGEDEAKESLQEVVDFLHNPGKYAKIGAKLPKGALLVGPPGTGKTLLAKAVAGEAGVPFFTISGSDFVEMFVGVGASRVRDLFEEAKKNAPCIIFIDEIDAVARRRGTGMGGGHDEREQTLNQLLVEMDGFGTNEGIIVMAATNRVDILDPAILRPGRFDRKITVSPPDVGGREAILKIHARNKKLGDDVDLKQVAQTTAGFTGADLENLLNEAAINTAMADRSFTNKEDIQKAFINVGIGVEKHSHIITDKEKKITAYHETGHAILFHVLPDVGPVYTVSIIPTGAGAAGYTMPLPEKDEMFLSRNRMLEEIMVSLGGRIAEEIIFGDITTGASSDIKKATHEARNMVTKYGMSKNIGVINYDEEEEDVFIGYDIAHNKKHSELMSGEIDKEVKAIIDACYKKAKEIILEYQDVLHKSAELLIEKEKIGRDEFEALFEGHEIPEDFNMEI